MKVLNLMGKYFKLVKSLHTLTYTYMDNRQKQMRVWLHIALTKMYGTVMESNTKVFWYLSWYWMITILKHHGFYMILQETSNNIKIFYHITCPKNKVLPWIHVQKHHSTTKKAWYYHGNFGVFCYLKKNYCGSTMVQFWYSIRWYCGTKLSPYSYTLVFTW